MGSFMLRDQTRRAATQYRALCETAAAMDITPVFSHTSALAYWGVAAPDDCTLPSDVQHISFPSGAKRRRFDNVASHVWSGEFATTDLVNGFVVAEPAMAWAQIAAHCSEESLAVTAGALMSRDPQRRTATLDELVSYVERNTGFIGRSRCTATIPLLAQNTDSPPESVVYVLVLRNGLGKPEPNHRVDVGPDRYYLIDIAYPDIRLGIEYQGAYHADTDRMRADCTRWNALRRLGWEIVLVTADDLRTEAAKRLIVEDIRFKMERQSALLGLARSYNVSPIHTFGRYDPVN